jgi:hypothetical protein
VAPKNISIPPGKIPKFRTEPKAKRPNYFLNEFICKVALRYRSVTDSSTIIIIIFINLELVQTIEKDVRLC